MKIKKFKLVDGQVFEWEMTDEQYETFKEVQRPFWREQKQQQRHGCSIEKHLEDNGDTYADENSDVMYRLEQEENYQILEQNLLLIKEGLALLSDKQRVAVHKHFYLGMSYNEIAKEEGIDKSTVAERITSSLKKLKKLF